MRARWSGTWRSARARRESTRGRRCVAVASACGRPQAWQENKVPCLTLVSLTDACQGRGGRARCNRSCSCSGAATGHSAPSGPAAEGKPRCCGPRTVLSASGPQAAAAAAGRQEGPQEGVIMMAVARSLASEERQVLVKGKRRGSVKSGRNPPTKAEMITALCADFPRILPPKGLLPGVLARAALTTSDRSGDGGAGALPQHGRDAGQSMVDRGVSLTAFCWQLALEKLDHAAMAAPASVAGTSLSAADGKGSSKLAQHICPQCSETFAAKVGVLFAVCRLSHTDGFAGGVCGTPDTAHVARESVPWSQGRQKGCSCMPDDGHCSCGQTRRRPSHRAPTTPRRTRPRSQVWCLWFPCSFSAHHRHHDGVRCAHASFFAEKGGSKPPPGSVAVMPPLSPRNRLALLGVAVLSPRWFVLERREERVQAAAGSSRGHADAGSGRGHAAAATPLCRSCGSSKPNRH